MMVGNIDGALPSSFGSSGFVGVIGDHGTTTFNGYDTADLAAATAHGSVVGVIGNSGKTIINGGHTYSPTGFTGHDASGPGTRQVTMDGLRITIWPPYTRDLGPVHVSGKPLRLRREGDGSINMNGNFCFNSGGSRGQNTSMGFNGSVVIACPIDQPVYMISAREPLDKMVTTNGGSRHSTTDGSIVVDSCTFPAEVTSFLEATALSEAEPQSNN
jgi:hypothetical protein